MKKSIRNFMNYVELNNPGEPEFLQAVHEVAEIIIPFMEKDSKYNKMKLLERIAEPERVVLFRVRLL